MVEIVDENCTFCGEGTPLWSGVYGIPDGRVRWALWTCGHMWSSDTEEPTELASWRQRAFAGLRRHAPLGR